MSNGVLLFAFDNEEIDYVKQAQECAKRVKHYLDVPVALVTDKQVSNNMFDHVIHIDEKSNFTKRIYSNGNKSTSSLTFRNTARSQAYDITPFDKTLVMDVDYMLNTRDLAEAFNNSAEFQIYKSATDIHPNRDNTEFLLTSPVGPEFYWATVFCFEKTQNVKFFFDLLKQVQNNYSYYVEQYKFQNVMFRNDYLFSIVINLVGKEFVTELPGKMFYSLDRDMPISLTYGIFKAFTTARRSKIPVELTNSDIHIMNKYWLESVL